MRERVEIKRVDSREEMEERSLTQRFIDAMGGLSGIPERGDYSLGTVMLQAIEKFSAMRAVQDELQSSLAAMRQRAEEAGKSAEAEETACIEALKKSDELEDILGNIAACFDQEFSSSYGPESIAHDITELQENRDIWQSKVEGLEKKVREAIARAERAEACLRSLDPYFDFSALPSGAEGFVVTGDAAGLTEVFAEAASILSSSPPADVSKMGGEAVSKMENAELLQKMQRLANSLDEILNYSGGADNALEDEYVMERANAALAEMEQKS